MIRSRKTVFSLIAISAVLLIAITLLYAHYWLIPLYEMYSANRQTHETGIVESVTVSVVTEPEKHRQKYVVLSLKSGRNLYIHETLAELLGEGCSDADSLINKQIHVSYLRRDTFENDGRILLSLRIAGEDWITLKDTTNAFRKHTKAPVYTVALTIAVLWVSYLSICVFSGVRKYMRLHRKRTKKRGKTGFIRKADSVSASAARVSMHHPENRENTAQRQPGSVDFFTRLVILVFPPA